LCCIKHKSKEGDQLFLHKERVRERKRVCLRERWRRSERAMQCLDGGGWGQAAVSAEYEQPSLSLHSPLSLSLSLSLYPSPSLLVSGELKGKHSAVTSLRLSLSVPALLHTYLTENSHLTVPHMGHTPMKPRAGTYNIQTLIYHQKSVTS